MTELSLREHISVTVVVAVENSAPDFLMLRYLAASFRLNMGKYFKQTRFRILINGRMDYSALLEENDSWLSTYDHEVIPSNDALNEDRWWSIDCFAQSCDSEVVLVVMSHLLVSGDLSAIVERAANEDRMFAAAGWSSPFQQEEERTDKEHWTDLFRRFGCPPPEKWHHYTSDLIHGVDGTNSHLASGYLLPGLVALPGSAIPALAPQIQPALTFVRKNSYTSNEYQIALALAINKIGIDYEIQPRNFCFPVGFHNSQNEPWTNMELAASPTLLNCAAAIDRNWIFGSTTALEDFVYRSELTGPHARYQEILRRVHATIVDEHINGRPLFFSKGLSFFKSSSRPYYIFAPDYRHSSAGIRCLHQLCHALNQLGEDAYIVNAKKFNEKLKTQALNKEIIVRHYLDGKQPIIVYPEVVTGNPLKIPSVARWLLNRPGHLGGDTEFDSSEEIFYFDEWCLAAGINGQHLNLPTVDSENFNNKNSSQTRDGTYYYANKYLLSGEPLDKELTGNATSLGLENPLEPEVLADILKKAEVLFCYELSSLIAEALSCGCPVLIVPSDYWNKHGSPLIFQTPGIELAGSPSALTKAKTEVSNYKNITSEQYEKHWRQVENFIQTTKKQPLPDRVSLPNSDLQDVLLKWWLLPKEERQQKASAFAAFYEQILAESTSKSSPKRIDTSVNATNPLTNLAWLNKRKVSGLDWDTTIQKIRSSRRNLTSFSLQIRLNQGEIPKLADTLDSLAQQVYDNWSLDVVSTLPVPAAVEDHSLLGWHTIETLEHAGSLVYSLGAREGSDWIIELPPGAILDPLYLWRLADEIDRHPDARGFFVDDYTIDADGICTQLRLKPGVNIEHLLSMDLAGPICIRRDSWGTTEARGVNNGSPWFSQLLNIADKFGWSSIRHIPDTLISYTGTFPSDTEACLLALYQHLSRTAPGSEILAATGKSWRIRYPLTSTPRISIAVLSSNQPELLQRCLESIVQKTSYPDFEIFLQLSPEESCDQLIAEWLTQHQAEKKTRLTIVERLETDALSAQINRAAQLIPGEFVVFIRDDAVIIQPEWLDELIRTALQSNVAVVAPRLIRAGDAKISSVGQVLGLRGILDSPYANEATLKDSGYLDYLQVARDVTSVSNVCALFRKTAYKEAQGIDESLPDNNLAWADLCLKLAASGKRLLCQPLATVVDGHTPPLDIEAYFADHPLKKQAKAKAENDFIHRWLSVFPSDPFWNPNLSLHSAQLIPETDYFPQWQQASSNSCRIFARPLPNVQGAFRITSPLAALCRQGKVSKCIWPMEENGRELSVAELLRLAPDTLIVQHYLHDKHLAALEAWNRAPGRPFIVYTLDDLISNLAKSNPFFKNIPANSRTRLKYALERCDRLVTSTEFLAETYRHFCPDIRVVPNRLEQEKWLHLRSRKRTTAKPRIGWAGGTTHQGDLAILKEVIEQTRSQADWIFFGMCPPDIRPLLAEFHPHTRFADYPARLASLNLDIAVAPLAEHPFNRGKSNLRLLEYGILGIPVVCTDIDPYKNSPACRVANNTEAWIAALRDRIHNPDAREAEGRRMRTWVRDNFLLEAHLETWLAAHLPG